MYPRFTVEIKNILIDNNFVNPSELDRADLIHYLTRTNGTVPPGFTTTHTDLTWNVRGTHTKPALRE
jgi:hypothetical protein